jgi:hypothetical protein
MLRCFEEESCILSHCRLNTLTNCWFKFWRNYVWSGYLSCAWPGIVHGNIFYLSFFFKAWSSIASEPFSCCSFATCFFICCNRWYSNFRWLLDTYAHNIHTQAVISSILISSNEYQGYKICKVLDALLKIIARRFCKQKYMVSKSKHKWFCLQ